MKLMTSGYLHQLFKKQDPGTIIRRNNVRKVVRDSGIKHIMTNNIILIDVDQFLSKANPYKIKEHDYVIPRLRSITTAANEWNNNRKNGERFIHKDEIHALITKNIPVFRYKHGNRWIINYDQLEEYLKELSKTKNENWEKLLKYWNKKNQSSHKK